MRRKEKLQLAIIIEKCSNIRGVEDDRSNCNNVVEWDGAEKILYMSVESVNEVAQLNPWWFNKFNKHTENRETEDVQRSI